MARAFAKNEILFPSHPVEGLLNFFDQKIVIRGLEVTAGKIGLDGDRAHIDQRTVQTINAVHEDGIFIDVLLFDRDKPLANGLDVSDAWIMLLEGCNQPEGHGSLAIVLARSGDEDAGRGSVHVLRSSGARSQTPSTKI